MAPVRQEMTFEEYSNVPKKLGWKYEYYDGALHRSPAWTAVARFRASTQVLSTHAIDGADSKHPSLRTLAIRPLLSQDQPLLLELFCESFDCAIEYAGYRACDIIRYAHKSLDVFFSDSPATYRNACQVAVIDDCLVGAATIAQCDRGAILQPIFVAPKYHRRGVATRLLNESVRRLVEMGCWELHSRCNLGNEASMNWHAKCGFVEVPEENPASHRANIFSQEAERHERLNLPTAKEMRELAEFWISERNRLYDERFKE